MLQIVGYTKQMKLPSRPPFQTYPQIDTPRFCLRKIEPSNFGELVGISFYDGVAAQDVEKVQIQIAQIHLDYAKGNSLHWGIFKHGSNDLLGTCGYYRGFQEDQGEVGYILKPAHRGQGYFKEILGHVVGYGFTHLDLHTVFADTAADNLASRAVLESCGFQWATNEADQLVRYRKINPQLKET